MWQHVHQKYYIFLQKSLLGADLPSEGPPPIDFPRFEQTSDRGLLSMRAYAEKVFGNLIWM